MRAKEIRLHNWEFKHKRRKQTTSQELLLETMIRQVLDVSTFSPY